MINNNNPDHIEDPDPATDYHGHPKYLMVLFALLAMMAFSLVIGNFTSVLVETVLIFAVAFWKSALVVRNFMHLKYEPLLLWVAVAAVFFCLVAFFFGVYPDVTASQLDVAPK